MLWSAVPLPSPMLATRAPVRALSRRGREKPRAHVTVRRSRLFLDEARYSAVSPLVKGQKVTFSQGLNCVRSTLFRRQAAHILEPVGRRETRLLEISRSETLRANERIKHFAGALTACSNALLIGSIGKIVVDLDLELGPAAGILLGIAGIWMSSIMLTMLVAEGEK